MVLTGLFSCVNKRSIFYWKNRDWSTFVYVCVCVCVCEMVELWPEESIWEFSQIHTHAHILTHTRTHSYLHTDTHIRTYTHTKAGNVYERDCVSITIEVMTPKNAPHTYILLSLHWKLWYWCSRWWKENKYRYKSQWRC